MVGEVRESGYVGAYVCAGVDVDADADAGASPSASTEDDQRCCQLVCCDRVMPGNDCPAHVARNLLD